MFRIIITFIIIYLVFRVLTTYIFPWIAKWYLRRFRERFFRDNPQYRQQRERRKENEVHISGTVPRSSSHDVGEYVDFEEIKEDKKEKQPKEKK